MDYQFWATLDGATKLAPPTSKTGAWVPMIFTILEALNGSLDSTELLDVAVCVALNIMFYSLISSRSFPKGLWSVHPCHPIQSSSWYRQEEPPSESEVPPNNKFLPHQQQRHIFLNTNWAIGSLGNTAGSSMDQPTLSPSTPFCIQNQWRL